MLRRVLGAALAALLMLPAAGVAQQMMPLQDDPSWGPRFRITPFIGHFTGFDREEEWLFRTASESGYVQADMEIAGGTAVGLNIALPLAGRFGITAAGAYASRGETVFSVRQTGEVLGIDGNDVFMGRLGIVLHVNEEESEFVLRRLNVSLFAGAVAMHERPQSTLGTDEFVEPGTHFGANFGVSAALPFASDRFAVQVGIEDNVLWWDKTQLESLAFEYFGQPGGDITTTTVSTGPAHAWLLRAGLSLRFR